MDIRTFLQRRLRLRKTLFTLLVCFIALYYIIISGHQPSSHDNRKLVKSQIKPPGEVREFLDYSISAEADRRRETKASGFNTSKHRKFGVKNLPSSQLNTGNINGIMNMTGDTFRYLGLLPKDLEKTVKNLKRAQKRYSDHPHSQIEYGDNKYHGIDLMTLPPFSFDPTYKNPCWKENGTLRCLPYFFIIGVKKCGTSHLWRHIAIHPDFAQPGFGKEAQWFARRRFGHKHAVLKRWNYPKTNLSGRFDGYIDLFRRAAEMIDTSRTIDVYRGIQPRQRITGDGSPSNLHLNSHWRYLPGNENLQEPRYVILDYIHHVLPKAKIIIIFRDPVERLYSEYYHQFGRLKKTFISSPKHFHKIIAFGLRLYKECLKSRTVRSCVYDERIYVKTGINIQLGIYHVYWQELTRLFPMEQIMVLQNQDLDDMTRVMDRVYGFLDMRAMPKPQRLDKISDRHFNARRLKDVMKGDMLNETRQLLDDFYKPFNEEMFRATGDRTFLYNDDE